MPLASVLIVAATAALPPAIVERTLAGGKATCAVTAADGDFVEADVDQGETDLAVTVVAPDGTRLFTRDGRDRSVEPVAFIAAQTGAYRLLIESVARAGRVTIRVHLYAPRPVRDGDRARLDAEAMATEARARVRKGDNASLREALDLRTRMRADWETAGRRDMVLASVSGAADLEYRFSRYDAARTHYEEALALSREIGSRRDEAEILNNLGLTAWRQGRTSDGRQLLERALPLWNALGHERGAALTLNNLGILMRQVGDYDAARQVYARSLQLSRRTGERRTAALTLSNMGVVLEALGRRRDAIAHYRQAAAIFATLDDGLAQGRSLLAQARAESQTTPAIALRHAREALALISTAPDRVSRGDAILLVARLMDRTGDAAGAAPQFAASLALFREAGSPRGEADALHAMALSSAVSQPGEALQLLESARAIRERLGLRGLEAETLIDIARQQRRLGHADAAQLAIESALGLVESIQASVFERELRTTYLATVMRYFADYTGLLLARHAAAPDQGFEAKALEAVERARSLAVVARIRERNLLAAPEAPANLLDDLRENRRAVNYWSLQLWQQADSAAAPTASAARRALDAALAGREAAEAGIRRADPRYAALMQPTTTSVASIQRRLPADAVLVEFMLGDDTSFVWAVTKEEIRVAPLPGRGTIEPLARRFIAAMRVNPEDGGATRAAADRAAARRRLSAMLLGPVTPLIGNRRIVVVPDGVLHVVPFGALAGADSRPLAEGHDLVVAPSAATFVLLTGREDGREPAPHLVAAIGDPVFNAWDKRLGNAARPAAAGTRALSRVPGTRAEVASIKALAPVGESFTALDFDASRSTVLPRLADFRYLHFATHAVDDAARPELSGIVLSLFDRHGGAQDGFIRLDDISRLSLRAELVVLSACDTAAGHFDAAGGLVNLSRAFFYGGARRVVATLWPVSDDATAEMMRHFYAALLTRHLPPATALRAAQAAMRADARWRDEYYWSGFVLQGTF